jgi:hypothetical protein
MSKDLIKEAEENIINQAVFFKDLLSIVEFFNRVGYRYFPQYENRDKDDYFKGLYMMRDALQSQYVTKHANLLGFVAIGGEKAKEYSLNEFKSMYGENVEERYMIMHLLNKYGAVPNGWVSDDEKEFRKQIADRLKEA